MQIETINQRIKKLRKVLDLTQQAFADRLGISRGNIATYETREGSPGNSVIALICREFGVNEAWLRTGKGEMFTKAPNTALEELAVDFYLDPFDEALVDEYLHLTPNNRKAIRAFFYRVLMKSVGDKKPEELLKTEMGYPSIEEALAYAEDAKRAAIQEYFSKMQQGFEVSEEITPARTKAEQEARAEADEFYQQILQEKIRAAESSASQSDTGSGGTKQAK